MRVLFTGASSAPGERVLRRLLEHADYSAIWCGIHHRDFAINHPKLYKFPLDLASEVRLDQIPAPLDLTIHFAAVTHAQDETAYWNINFGGTQRLVEAVRVLGCRRFGVAKARLGESDYCSPRRSLRRRRARRGRWLCPIGL